jgi:hypothetical protein
MALSEVEGLAYTALSVLSGVEGSKRSLTKRYSIINQ